MKHAFVFLLILAICYLPACTTGGVAAPENNQTEQTSYIEVQKAYLTEQSEDRQVSIELPVIPGRNQEAIHGLLWDFVESKLESDFDIQLTLGESGADIPSGSVLDTKYWVDVDARITWQSEDLVSIVFEGMYNNTTAAHPTHLFFAINIAPEQGRQVFLEERVAIDRALYETFADCAERDILTSLGGKWPQSWDSFGEELCGEAAFLNGLREEKAFYWYYTESGVGISYPVPFSMGCHMETVVPFEKL